MTCVIQNSSPNYTTLQNFAEQNQLISELSITESHEIETKNDSHQKILTEFRSSAIPDRLTLANVSWIEGDAAVELLTEQAISDVQRVTSYVTSPAQKIIARYEFAAAGGWYAMGTTISGGTGTVPYFKPLKPRQKSKFQGFGLTPKVKTVKYETPMGCEAMPLLPWVDAETAQKIYDRYAITPNTNESFWQAVARFCLPIAITEGLKKALALVAHGTPAIAIRGIAQWHRAGEKTVHPTIAGLLTPGQRVYIVFDQDDKIATQKSVKRQILDLGFALEKIRCKSHVVLWDGAIGKGIDDCLFNLGNRAQNWLDALLADAIELREWQIRERLTQQLTWEPTLTVTSRDLSTLDTSRLPAVGIVAIVSEKGTGKTKLTAALTIGQEKVLAPSHRIALSRNACDRLKLDYRGDLDKTPDGRFITGGGYTLRVGFCVDSLLAINPEQFEGCDLVIDEAVQVVRHLLTSSTCAQDGKRPALLARFKQLVRTARRVILADADLDNATLHYFRELRGDSAPVFLIRNDYEPDPYPVTLVRSRNFETVAAQVVNDLRQLAPGKTLFVATDNKGVSKSIARLVADGHSADRILTINAETSGGEAEREFIATPDTVLQRGDYDLVIASPSLATGVSIEVQGIIARVYGIFTGVSSTDADILQSLARVREPVERVVWVSERGRNYSKVSRSSNALTVKATLIEQTTVTASIARANLGVETLAAIQGYNWQADPNLNLYCKIAADQNFAMANLRDCVWTRLKMAGHRIRVEDRDFDPIARFLYRQAATEQKRLDAVAISEAEILDYSQAKALEQKESRTTDEELSLQRFHLCEFYAITPEILTPEFVLWDADGRRRGELLNLESILTPDTAIDSTTRALEKQMKWNQGATPWDISGAALRRGVRQAIGLDTFLDPDREWTADDCAAPAEKARVNSRQIQNLLHFTPSAKLSDVQIVHQLISQMGLKISSRWRGTGDKKHRVYRLNMDVWQKLTEILECRQNRRLALEERQSNLGSPPTLITKNIGGDPKPEAPLDQGLASSTERLTHQNIEDVAESGKFRGDISQRLPLEPPIISVAA
jgi:Domain of unknown function (DUF3854)